jgi:hypothetical protein
VQIKPYLSIKDHIITKFPDAPKSGSTDRIQSRVLLVCHPESSNRNIIMTNLNVENAGYEFPNLLRHNALEKEMINALIFRVENTTNRFIQISFKQIIPSHKLVMRKEPQKNVNSRRYY